jgi:hypothetical protein
MAEAGLPVLCIETRHTRAFLKAQVNKSDRDDARGIAQMMRANLFRPVHMKTLGSPKHRKTACPLSDWGWLVPHVRIERGLPG